MWKWLKAIFSEPQERTALERLTIAVKTLPPSATAVKVSYEDYGEALNELDSQRCIYLPPKQDGPGFRFCGIDVIPSAQVAPGHLFVT